MFKLLGKFFGQVRIYFFWRLVRWLSIKPFVIIDPNEYCPACGHRKGHILSMTDGQKVAIRHFCEECGHQWDVETVTEIDPKTIIPLQTKEEGEEENGRPARFVKIPIRGEGGVQVNGQTMPEKGGIGDRKKAVTAAL